MIILSVGVCRVGTIDWELCGGVIGNLLVSV